MLSGPAQKAGLRLSKKYDFHAIWNDFVLN